MLIVESLKFVPFVSFIALFEFEKTNGGSCYMEFVGD